MARFQDKLRAARERRGLSRAELAVLVGLSDRTIENYEQGRRGEALTVAVLLRLALSLGVSMANLADDPGPKRPAKKRPRGRPPGAKKTPAT
jgi:transcriptional regulator with XRE-family HTH domain